MVSGRVLLGFRLLCPKAFCFQGINSVPFRNLYSSFTNHIPKVRAIQTPAHWFGLQGKTQPSSYMPTVNDMQPSCISYGREINAVASDDKDEDEEGENLVGQKSRMQQEEKIISDQMDADIVVREVITDPETSTVPSAPKASNEKISKSKMRREKKKLMKKKLNSAVSSASLMSELPFALTSPTTWKELGFTNSNSTKRKRKRGNSGGRVDSEEDGDTKKKKKGSQRPNYFLSIPITNAQISSAVTEVQEAVLQQEPRLAKAMVPVATLHITLLVTHLAHQEQVDLAAAVLAQAKPSVAELLGGRDLMLPFTGISHFRKEVVFVGLAAGHHRDTLDSLAGLLRSRFEEQGLLQGDGRGFQPHLTIMKMSRASQLRSQGIKRVDSALYSDYTSKFFGNQMVERVDLCSMLKKKQQDGYYHTEKSLQLS